MNILIVGNGFDLSHYLPTKYDHFMVAMDAIEKWDIANGEMSFDDLFGSLYEKEDYFFGYTKAMYKTDEIKISVEQVIKLKKKLEENVWYQYFADHVREVKTWIDFEDKISQALKILMKFIEKLSIYLDKSNASEINFYSLKSIFKAYQMDINEKEKDVITIFKLFLEKVIEKDKESIFYEQGEGEYSKFWEFNESYLLKIEKAHLYFLEFRSDLFINFIYESLNVFIEIFNFYLCKIVNSLELLDERLLKTYSENFPDIIYSFNYTNTFFKRYGNRQVDFLHGKIGADQNIVLGVSEIEREILEKYKIYGFLKYHQKLLKDTDYLFLNNYIKETHRNNEEISELKPRLGQGYDEMTKQSFRAVIQKLKKLNIQIFIWGHSLDVSDKSYIAEIFSFNYDYDQQVRVIIFYFNQTAKFDLLANLIHILGNELIEKWMKNGWLKFKPNPDIAELNNIKPVELPKIAEA